MFYVIKLENDRREIKMGGGCSMFGRNGDVRKHIVAEGHVQECGFRYYTMMAARKYHLTGWVMNCEDGTVEMEVQGKPLNIHVFMNDIKTGNRFARVDHLWVSDREVIAERGLQMRN